MPIPGTKRRSHLNENLGALDVALSKASLASPAKIFPLHAAIAERHAPMAHIEK